LKLITQAHKCHLCIIFFVARGGAQLVEVLRYKSEGRRFDFRCCHWILSLT